MQDIVEAVNNDDNNGDAHDLVAELIDKMEQAQQNLDQIIKKIQNKNHHIRRSSCIISDFRTKIGSTVDKIYLM